MMKTFYQNGPIVCGGRGGGDDDILSMQSCDTFSKTNGTWMQNIQLQSKRAYHTSWNVPDDKGVLLVGGFYANTELVYTIDGTWHTKVEFDLKHYSL